MRILQINAVYDTKSTGRTCKELHDWAMAHGHEVLTVYGNEPRTDIPTSEAIYLGSTFSHKLHALTGRLASDAGIGSWRATRRLLNLIRSYRPDVVHLRNLHGNFVHIPILLRFLAKEDIPTVVHNHDCFWFTGGCMHYTVSGCDGWRKDCSGCQHLHRGKNYLITNRAEAVLKRKTELFGTIPRLATIGVSQWTATQAAASTALRQAPVIDYVYNWVDLEIFSPKGAAADNSIRRSLGLNKDDIMVLGVASGWGLSKGLDHFIQLREMLPPTTKILLVGKLDSTVTLPKGILTFGTTESTARLAELYSAANVFVHLSLEETFGKVTAEALACGTPAIVYNSTASPELVTTETGCVVAPGDLRAVAEAIPRLVAACPPEACRARAQSLFNISINAVHLFEIYQETINIK